MHRKTSVLEKVRLFSDPNAYFINKDCILSHTSNGLQSIYTIYRVTEKGATVLLSEPEIRVLSHNIISVIKERPYKGAAPYKASVVYRIPSLEPLIEAPLRDILYYNYDTTISTAISDTGAYQYGIQIARGYNGEVFYKDNSLPVRESLVFKLKEWVLFRDVNNFMLLNAKTQKIMKLFNGKLLLGTHSLIITTKILNYGVCAESVDEDYPILILNFDNNSCYKVKRNNLRIITNSDTTKDSWVADKNSTFYTKLVHDTEAKGVHLKALISEPCTLSVMDIKSSSTDKKEYKKGTLLIEDIYTKYIGRE